MRSTLLIIFSLFISISNAQEAFEGKLVYQVEMVDTAYQKFFEAREMVVYTNDTIVRIENTTDQLGEQVLLRHLILDKSYLLLSIPAGNFAIQTKLDTLQEQTSEYAIKKKCKRKKIAGIKGRKLVVNHVDFDEPQEFYYTKDIACKYLDGFEEFPGLLLEYYVKTPDGTLKYTLKSFEPGATNRDLYGVPSDYIKLTLDEFIMLFSNQGNQEIGE